MKLGATEKLLKSYDYFTGIKNRRGSVVVTDRRIIHTVSKRGGVATSDVRISDISSIKTGYCKPLIGRARFYIIIATKNYPGTPMNIYSAKRLFNKAEKGPARVCGLFIRVNKREARHLVEELSAMVWEIQAGTEVQESILRDESTYAHIPTKLEKYLEDKELKDAKKARKQELKDAKAASKLEWKEYKKAQKAEKEAAKTAEKEAAESAKSAKKNDNKSAEPEKKDKKSADDQKKSKKKDKKPEKAKSAPEAENVKAEEAGVNDAPVEEVKADSIPADEAVADATVADESAKK